MLTVFYCTLIACYLYGWWKIPERTTNIEAKNQYKYSVLIPARNEEHVIEKCVSDIVKQNFPKDRFEIIVINDYSDDATAERVLSYIQKDNISNLRLLNLADDALHRKFKKAAITYGIEQSQGDYIILTDADCERNESWLQAIDSFIQQKQPKMIYAPVAFKAANTFERMQALEFAGLVGIGGAAIQLKNPNMCSAANLIVEKKTFEEVDGYKGDENIVTGDDEFLLHKVFRHYPEDVFFLKHRDTVVFTSANVSLKQLAEQRKRWVSKSTKYENRFITAILVGAYLFNAAIVWQLIFNTQIGLAMLLCKTIIEALFLYSVLKFFKRQHYLWLLPIAEIFHIIYVLIIGILANTRAYDWKGRHIAENKLS